MGLLLSLALRNATRNRRRTALTALTVTFGAALLTLAMAWVGGVFDGILIQASNIAGHVRVVQPDFARKEQLYPLDENIADVAPVLEAVRKVPGVTRAYPRIAIGVTATVGDEIGERFGMLQGAPVEYFAQELGIDTHLREGRMLRTDDEIVMGRTFAGQVGAKVGDELVTLGQTQDGSMSPAKFTVVGISDMGGNALDKMAFVTLAKAQYIADMDGGAVEVLVFGERFGDAAALAASVAASPGLEKLQVTSWDGRPPFDQMIGIFRTIQGIALTVIVFITALGVLNTMLMSVLERTAEIGVMRAMGLRGPQTVMLFVSEAMGIAVIGGAVGAAIGGAAALWLEQRGVNVGAGVSKLPDSLPINQIVYPNLTPQILVYAVCLSLVMALLGGALPALRAARIQPVEAMRSHH